MVGQVAGCVGDDPVTSTDSGGVVVADGSTPQPDSSSESATGAMEIHRSAVTGGASPQFAAPVRASLACPMANCGTPVVPTNEGMLLFGTWAAGGFDPTVREAVLAVGGGAVSTSGIVDHPELGAHYPSWISDDGCEVLLGGGGVSQVADVAYARRAPK